MSLPLGNGPGVSLPLGLCLLFLIPRERPAQGRLSVPAWGMWGQEARFGMALPSSLGSDFVFVNVSFLPPGSHELWGRQSKH